MSPKGSISFNRRCNRKNSKDDAKGNRSVKGNFLDSIGMLISSLSS